VVETDINKENDDGSSLFYYVYEKWCENILKYLVELGVDIYKENINGKTPLFDSCSSRNEILVKYLS